MSTNPNKKTYFVQLRDSLFVEFSKKRSSEPVQLNIVCMKAALYKFIIIINNSSEQSTDIITHVIASLQSPSSYVHTCSCN